MLRAERSRWVVETGELKPGLFSILFSVLCSILFSLAKERYYRDTRTQRLLEPWLDCLSLSFSPLRETFASYRLEISCLLFTARSRRFRLRAAIRTRANVLRERARNLGDSRRLFCRLDRDSARECRSQGCGRETALRRVRNLSGWTDKARVGTRSARIRKPRERTRCPGSSVLLRKPLEDFRKLPQSDGDRNSEA